MWRGSDEHLVSMVLQVLKSARRPRRNTEYVSWQPIFFERILHGAGQWLTPRLFGCQCKPRATRSDLQKSAEVKSRSSSLSLPWVETLSKQSCRCKWVLGRPERTPRPSPLQHPPRHPWVCQARARCCIAQSPPSVTRLGFARFTPHARVASASLFFSDYVIIMPSQSFNLVQQAENQRRRIILCSKHVSIV